VNDREREGKGTGKGEAQNQQQAGWVMLASMLLVLLLAWPLMNLMQQVYFQVSLQSKLALEFQAQLNAAPLTTVIQAEKVGLDE